MKDENKGKHSKRISATKLKIQEVKRRIAEQRKLIRLSANRMPTAVKLSTSKLLIYAFLIVAQLAGMVFAFVLLRQYVNTSVFLIVSKSLAVIFAFYILNSKTPGEFKLTWIMFVLIFTVLGMLAYLIFGYRRVSKRRRKKLGRRIDSILSCNAQDETLMAQAREKDAFAADCARYVYANGRMPLSTASGCEYFDIGEKYFERLKEELEKAERFIFMEFFIIGEGSMWDELYAILARRSRAGVDVRITYDDLGSIPVIPKNFARNCLDAGIKFYCFNKVRPFLDVAQNNRTHRKIVVIDGVTAFTGGLNISDEYINRTEKYGHWKDTGVMITGKAVENFTLMFLLVWDAKFGGETVTEFLTPERAFPRAESDMLCLPFCDTPGTGKAICEEMYLKIIYNAKDYVYINTPYLIISDKMQGALISAAESGVDVRITVPHIPDKKFVFALTRAFYAPLVLAGVKVYEYKPGFIHAKSIVSDGKYSVIGSSNMDFRSFYLHYECNVFICGGIAEALADDYEKTCALSLPVTVVQIKNRPLLLRLSSSFLRLFAPLM